MAYNKNPLKRLIFKDLGDFIYSFRRICPPAGGAVAGSDSPPSCHSTPALQILLLFMKKAVTDFDL
jgi:hypothetical protein